MFFPTRDLTFRGVTILPQSSPAPEGIPVCAKLFEPQAQVSPLESMAKAWLAPAWMETIFPVFLGRGRPMRVGIRAAERRRPMRRCPSWDWSPLPQPNMLPSASRARQKSLPALRSVILRRFGMRMGSFWMGMIELLGPREKPKIPLLSCDRVLGLGYLIWVSIDAKDLRERCPSHIQGPHQLKRTWCYHQLRPGLFRYLEGICPWE